MCYLETIKSLLLIFSCLWLHGDEFFLIEEKISFRDFNISERIYMVKQWQGSILPERPYKLVQNQVITSCTGQAAKRDICRKMIELKSEPGVKVWSTWENSTRYPLKALCRDMFSNFEKLVQLLTNQDLHDAANAMNMLEKLEMLLEKPEKRL